MIERYFDFETLITPGESKVKIELATDSRSTMRFDITLEDFEVVKQVLLFVDYLTMLKPANYEPSRIAYHDWYANELLRRIRSDEGFYNEQADAKKEVLKELVVRRNKLVKQLDKAMKHYANNKESIGEMEAIRANYQKAFPGPLLVKMEDYLMLENLTEYGDIFYQIGFDLRQERSEELVTGSGWLEYSKYFSDDLASMPYMSDGINLTNVKPRSDIRVIRRGDSHPFRPLGDRASYIAMIEEIGIMDNYFTGDRTKKFHLSKSDLYQLFQLIKMRFGQNRVISLKISAAKDAEFHCVQSGDDEITIVVNHDEEGLELSKRVNSSMFIAFGKLFHLLTEVTLTVFPNLFGLAIGFMHRGGEGRVYSNPRQSSADRHFRNLLVQHLATSHMELKDLLTGKSGIFRDKEYERMVEVSELVLSRRQKDSELLLELKPDLFTIGEKSVHFIEKSIQSKIELDGSLSFNCTCNAVHEKYLCQHLIGCMLLAFKEGIFDA